MLWGRNQMNEPVFLWNSSMAESNNSMIAREDIQDASAAPPPPASRMSVSFFFCYVGRDKKKLAHNMLRVLLDMRDPRGNFVGFEP